MKRMISLSSIVLLTVLLSGCVRILSRAIFKDSADDSRRKFHVKYTSTVKKQDILLTQNVQRQIENYYRRQGFWPLSLEGFLAESDDNRFAIQELYGKGFRDLSFIAASDTLFINFLFSTRGNLAVDNVDVKLGNDISGKFIVTMNNDFVLVQKVVDKPSR